MPDKPLVGKFFEFLQFSFQPPDNFFIHPGFRGEQADHDQFLGTLAYRPAQKAGVAFVENIDNTVIINVFSPFANNTAAGGTGGDFFRYRLIAFWTKFHRLRTYRTKTGQEE